MSIISTIFKKRPADSPIPLEQIVQVQASFAKIAPSSDLVADVFYERLFELDPELKPLFKGNMKSQKIKLIGMLTAAVHGISNAQAIEPIVRDMGRRHVGYGVREEDYSTVGAALLFTLEAGLADDWTDELKNAWITVYSWLAVTMKGAATQAA